MTDRIDLDDVEPEEPEEERPNRGDWFWRGEGTPDDEAADVDDEALAGDSDGPPAGSVAVDAGTDGDGTATSTETDASTADGEESDRTSDPIPHVPRKTKDRPVGIPKTSGGAGAGTSGGSGTLPAAEGETAADEREGAAEGSAPSGPHGGDADEMTLALTYRAAGRLAEPAYAFSAASQWSDWLGIVGDVPAHVITKFQREHGVDADFFSGSGLGPRERLADVDERSMFYAKRFVLVGCEGEEEWAPEGWEFIPVEEAAEKAGWDLE